MQSLTPGVTPFEFRVANDSDVIKTSNAIVYHVQQGTELVLSCIGAGAVNQAVKAVVRANTMLISKGTLLVVLPTFFRMEPTTTVQPDGSQLMQDGRTIMRMFIHKMLGAA